MMREGAVTSGHDNEATEIKASMLHDAGAYGRCSCCGRYSADRRVLDRPAPACACGSTEGWCGSFVSPGPDAHWSGERQAPAVDYTAMPPEDLLSACGMDAAKWAAAFVQFVRKNPEIPTDEGTMITWFANAIMRSLDEERWRREAAVADVLAQHGGAVTELRATIPPGQSRHLGVSGCPPDGVLVSLDLSVEGGSVRSVKLRRGLLEALVDNTYLIPENVIAHASAEWAVIGEAADAERSESESR